MKHGKPLERKTPLTAKTPLKRSSMEIAQSWLARSRALGRRAKLKPQSDKRREESVLRRQLVEAYLAEHPVCERCDAARAVDVHERQKRSRNPKAWLDVRQFAALCRACHQFTELEPAQAEAEGWLTPSWIDTDEAVSGPEGEEAR